MISVLIFRVQFTLQKRKFKHIMMTARDGTTEQTFGIHCQAWLTAMAGLILEHTIRHLRFLLSLDGKV